MIDLGPLGVLQVQGSFYLPFFLAALAVCALNRPFWAIGIITLIGWAGTRLIDMGGLVGNVLIATAETEQVAVASIAVCLAALDFCLAISVLYFSRHLKLSVLIFVAYVLMLPFYLAVVKFGMDGGAALFWVNIIGLAKLGLILAGGGGAALLRHSRRTSHRGLSPNPALDFVASWVLPKGQAERAMARASQGSRLS